METKMNLPSVDISSDISHYLNYKLSLESLSVTTKWYYEEKKKKKEETFRGVV